MVSFTIGSGILPDLPHRFASQNETLGVAGLTAGQEFRLALKINYFLV
jgi:hypothetical protein